MALFAITATFAPSIGPTLGGWLTESFSWRSIFYLNLVPGLLLLAAVWYAIAPQRSQLHRLRQGDWLGILAMAIGLGCLQVVLEEGTRKDWFGSPLILTLSLLAAIFLTVFFWIELTHAHPFINLRLLRYRNFGIASVVNVGLGLGLYGSIFILPLYLSQIQGYNAMQIGEVLMWMGFPQLVIIPLIPKLMQRLAPRFLLAMGVSLFAISCFMNATLTHDTGLEQLWLSQIVRALGQPLIMIPLATIATAEIPPEQAGSASGLFNMMRNLGGSLGIATLGTLLAQRQQLHASRLGEAISLYNPQLQERLTQMTQYFTSQGADLITAQQQAIAAIDHLVRREAYLMAYDDCFYFIGCALLFSGITVIFFKPSRGRGVFRGALTVAHGVTGKALFR